MSELDDLKERLAAAEQVCFLYGWTAGSLGGRSEREDAVTQAWMDWYNSFGAEQEIKLSSPGWQERVTQLSQKRRQIRSETLAKIRGEVQ